MRRQQREKNPTERVPWDLESHEPWSGLLLVLVFVLLDAATELDGQDL
jgi:hypothetical protein